MFPFLPPSPSTLNSRALLSHTYWQRGRRKNVPTISLRAVVPATFSQKAIAIEDLFEPNTYLEAVNECYKDSRGFNPPFAPISEESLNQEVPDTSQTITSRLESYFKAKFSEAPGFSKGAVAVEIAVMIPDGWQGDGLGNFERLIDQLRTDVQV